MNEAKMKKFVRILSEGLPISARPFKKLADKMNVTETEVIGMLEDLKKSGRLKKIGVSLNHRRLGMTANLMVVWDVPAKKMSVVVKVLRRARRITHLYERERVKGVNGNLFAMIHGKSRSECLRAADEISCRAGIRPAEMYFSTEELKKTPAAVK